MPMKKLLPPNLMEVISATIEAKECVHQHNALAEKNDMVCISAFGHCC
jgi:hypothetical protein